MPGSAKPRTIEIIGEGFLVVVWDEGHETVFAGPDLRENCPCAECRVKKERASGAPAVSSGLKLAFAPPRLIGFETVGRYALRLRWSDGHSAGLYEFRLLRGLCPCEECAKERSS